MTTYSKEVGKLLDAEHIIPKFSYTGCHQYAWPTYRPTNITSIVNLLHA